MEGVSRLRFSLTHSLMSTLLVKLAGSLPSVTRETVPLAGAFGSAGRSEDVVNNGNGGPVLQ